MKQAVSYSLWAQLGHLRPAVLLSLDREDQVGEEEDQETAGRDGQSHHVDTQDSPPCSEIC